MDERKKKMLMIGGVVALVVVVIIVAAVMMDHKKKVEQSPMIVQTTTGSIIVPANTPVSTLPTTGATTQGVTTTIPGTTRAITTTIPVSTNPPLTYIRSTGGLYLICEFDKPLSTTKLLSEATPVTFSKCPSAVEGTKFEYCLMFDNKNVKISPGGAIAPDGTYMIYIHSLSEKTYLGLVNTDAYLDLATLGFIGSISPSDASIWNVVSM